MRYRSTRDSSIAVSAPQSIYQGLSPEGGLFVPESFPRWTAEEIGELCGLPYRSRAARVLGGYLPEYTQAELQQAVAGYAAFSHPDVAPLVRVGGDTVYALELWHGPTHAFKDMALQVLPALLSQAMRKCAANAKVMILVATSGDTGTAALNGFADQPDTGIAVFYPDGGVSAAQRLQMVTQTGGNVRVCAVRGNFDDAQSAVKRAFGSAEFARQLAGDGVSLSAANSINWGRLAPQIAYYFSAYADLLKARRIRPGDPVHFAVPTGNFGNILAAYYAHRMGLPIGKLICASNANNVLYDFLQTGSYDARRDFRRTSSPSMDILISSNLERLLYELADRDSAQVAEWMAQLQSDGRYALSPDTMARLKGQFFTAWADESQTASAIREAWSDHGYLMDPHTAVAWHAVNAFRAENVGDNAPIVVVSTASPYKFSADVLAALGVSVPDDEQACMRALERTTGLPLPQSLGELFRRPVLHPDICGCDEIENWVLTHRPV